MFYIEHLLKKYGQALKREAKPESDVVSIKFKPGTKPEPKLSDNELSEVNSMIDKVSQAKPIPISLYKPETRIKERMAGKAIRDVRAGKAKPMHPLAAEGLKKDPLLRKEYLRNVGEAPDPRTRRAPAPRKPTTKEIMWNIPKTYWKGKLSEDRMSFFNNAIEKISVGPRKSRLTHSFKTPSLAPKTPSLELTREQKREIRFKAIGTVAKRRYGKAREKFWDVPKTYWKSKLSEDKAEFDVPTILEKIGAAPNLVETAKELERLSEEASRKTLLGFWQRLGRAAMSAKILATPEVRSEMMRERGLAGAAIGAPLGGLVGYAVRPSMAGTLAGAAIGGIGVGTLGAYLAKRKSQRAAELLKDPAAQRALVSELVKSMQERRPAELL